MGDAGAAVWGSGEEAIERAQRQGFGRDMGFSRRVRAGGEFYDLRATVGARAFVLDELIMMRLC